jgi:hypothetical protein
MNYSVIIITALITIIVFLIVEKGKLKRLSLGLYTKHSLTIGRGSFRGQKADRSTDITYFIARWKEEDFTQIAEQRNFLEKALKASGYDTDTFREQEFRTLAEDRGIEAVVITTTR